MHKNTLSPLLLSPLSLQALPHSSSASDAAASATATDDASSKASKNKDYVSFGPEATKPGIKSGLLPKAYKDASGTHTVTLPVVGYSAC